MKCKTRRCKNEQWESVIGLCESCYDKLCKKSASIKAPEMTNKKWNEIVGTMLR